ncbi:MAG: hypothetical protein QM656_14530 [Paracoccaceae bacterium]
MKKPAFFFYQFPTGGDLQFALWPLDDGSHRLEANGRVLGKFADLALATAAASSKFTEVYSDAVSADTAERILDIDWWERSPTNRPEKSK